RASERHEMNLTSSTECCIRASVPPVVGGCSPPSYQKTDAHAISDWRKSRSSKWRIVLESKDRAHVLTWHEMPKAMWALFDQAAVSLANFGLNYALARYASPEVYGQFVIVFALLLFVYGSIQAPLTLDPLIILGGKINDKETQFMYARRTLGFHLLISLVSIVVLLVVGAFSWTFQNLIYARAMLLASVPLLFMNLRFLIRCFYIMEGEFAKAFRSDLSVLIVVGLGAVGLVYLREPGDWAAVALMTIAEAAATLLLMTTKHKQLLRVFSGLVSDIKAQPMVWKWKEARQNWDYGKWLLLANGANYAYQNAQFLLLPVFVSLANLSGYRACYLLAQPIYLFTTGLEAYAWNRSAERMKSGGVRELQGFLWKMTWLVSTLILSYALLIGLRSHVVLETVYAGKFGEFAHLIWFFTTASLFAFWGKMLGTGLRALEATHALFSSTLYAGGIGLIAFLVLTKFLGVTGAAISYVGASFVSVLFLIAYWLKEAGLGKAGVEVIDS
ncbi:MAG: lipopolysaccharide biosynthesis protein, partial [Armatimonadota bacterium]